MINRSTNVLTPREREILGGLLKGSTTREIATSYGLGKQTVKNYVTVIYEKLGVVDRSQLQRVGQALDVAPVPIGAPRGA